MNSDKQIKVTVHNSFSYISKDFNRLPLDAQNSIVKQLSYKKAVTRLIYNDIYLFFRNPQADGDTGVYYKIPTGLLHKFWTLVKAYRFKFDFKDQRQGKLPSNHVLSLQGFFKRLSKIDPDIEDRDYQIQAIQKCLKHRRGLIEHATAAGKTVVIAGVVYCLNSKTMILCTGKEHVAQISKDMERYTGNRVTIYGCGSFNTSGQIVIANAQALNSMRKKDCNGFTKLMQKFRCVISDEAHHCGSISYRMPFYYATNAPYRFGFSGTMFREDGAFLEVEAAIGPVLDRRDYTYLEQNNYIVPAKFFFVDAMCNHLQGEDKYWPQCLQAGIVHNSKRNELIARIANQYVCKKKQVLIITPFRIEHGRHLEQLIPDSKFMFGNSGDETRKQTLNDFRNKKIMVLIGSRIYDEVINLPDTRCVILAGGGKAHNSFFQRVGRGIRKSPGKTHVDVVLFWDSHSWVLLKHSRKLKDYIRSVDSWRQNLKMVKPHRN